MITVNDDRDAGRVVRTRITPLPPAIECIQYDLAIVGAGINGCGIARDASMRGLRVLLVDMGDIGSQTTAWSTRLIHGGLRYLEHCELSLVRESLRERETLLRIASHLVEPLRFVVPIHEGSRRGPWAMRAGMLAYDALSARKRLPRHHMLTRNDTLSLEPGINPQGLLGAATYFDAQVTFPERLALENALSADEHGCDVVTYMRVNEIHTFPDGLARLTMLDQLSRDPVVATARVVVNATGPWVDTVAPRNGGGRLTGGTKGSHIILPRFHGAPRSAVYAEAPQDQRPFFVIPWNGLYLVGTTDSRYSGDPAVVTASADEAAYLLDQVNHVFPNATLSLRDVLYTYAGVRPLPYSPHGPTAAISRRHKLVRHEQPFSMVYSVIGGKLTTYRELAEQVTDVIFTHLDRRDPGQATSTALLPGAEPAAARPDHTMTKTDVDPRATERLRRVYGSRWTAIRDFALTRGRANTLKTSPALEAELEFATRYEFAETLEDVLMRRAMIGLSPTHGADAAEEASHLLGGRVGWNTERQELERQCFNAYLSRFAVPGSQ